MDKSIYSKEYKLFLELLKDARKHANLTQEELAQRLGESQSFISKCERGERRLDVIELRAWSHALGFTLQKLIKRLEQNSERQGHPEKEVRGG